MRDEKLWTLFRRLLLGTVTEALVAEEWPVELRGLELRFHEDSVFEVPRLDNNMRFKGEVSAHLTVTPSLQQVASLRARLERVWPEIVAVLDIPIGDRLTPDRNHVEVEVGPDEAGPTLRIGFDLEAD